MRENRPYGSEGGEAKAFPTPISNSLTFTAVSPLHFVWPRAKHRDWRVGIRDGGLRVAEIALRL